LNAKTKRNIGITALVLVITTFLLVSGYLHNSDVTAKEENTQTQVKHKITYEQVLQMRAKYSGEMQSSSFEINQVRELINQPQAKWLGVSYGFHDGKNSPILTIYDKNNNELTNMALEMSVGCPPNCPDMQTQTASTK
jgi:uncharacterized FlaG/YvyC family protein